MNFPTDLLYSKEHTWVRIENNCGTIGITEFAQQELGEIVYVDLPNKNDTFKQDEIFGSIEVIKTVSDLFMPISGTVIAVNEELLKEPTMVNTNPYTKGWLIKVEISNESFNNLLTAEAYAQNINL